MSEDILYQFKKINSSYTYDNRMYNITLNYINLLLERSGSCLQNFPNMPLFTLINPENIFSPKPSLIIDELNYEMNTLKHDLEDNVPKLNSDQMSAYNYIISRIFSNQIGYNAFLLTDQEVPEKHFYTNACYQKCVLTKK